MFLQVGEDRAIAVDKINMIKKTGDMLTEVHVEKVIYKLQIPFSTLMSMLQEDNNKISKILNILKETGNPAP